MEQLPAPDTTDDATEPKKASEGAQQGLRSAGGGRMSGYFQLSGVSTTVSTDAFSDGTAEIIAGKGINKEMLACYERKI